MSQNAPGRLFTSAVCHSSADLFNAMLEDYVKVNLHRLPLKINPRDFIFFHNPGLCRGFAVVTSAFKILTCVTGCAYVHTAQTINNNSNCCNSTRVYWVTQRRAKVTRKAFIKTSVTQSQHALQRSQDLAAFVTGQPSDDYTEKTCSTADSERATHTRVSSSFVYHNSRLRGQKQLGDTLAPQRKRKCTDERFKKGKRWKHGGKDHIMCGILSAPTPHFFSPLLKRLSNHSEQGSTVLADNISSDVNGILLVFSATPEAGPSEAAVTEQDRAAVKLWSGFHKRPSKHSLTGCQTKLQF